MRPFWRMGGGLQLKWFGFFAAIALTACQHGAPASDTRSIATIDAERAAEVDQFMRDLMSRHGVLTAGVGVLSDGELVWAGYYGEQAPGTPATRETLFNVASLTKTVTAETVLRLAAADALSLDEPMSPYWLDPDLADDARHALLTPRLALSHRTGFPNWRFMSEGRRLSFIADPGETFGYSGEGFEYVARFAERRANRGFDDLARAYVFESGAITDAAVSPQPELYARIAVPVLEGETYRPYCRPSGRCTPEGEWSAADDLVVSVEAYAAFLSSAIAAQGLTPEIAEQRTRVYSPVSGPAAIVDCDAGEAPCPVEQGYGLGWEVARYGPGDAVITHGGSDWAELALAYYYSLSGDGLIVFLNGAGENNLAAMAEIVAVFDPRSPLIGRYQRWQSLANN